jgi:hypothetical protein
MDGRDKNPARTVGMGERSGISVTPDQLRLKGDILSMAQFDQAEHTPSVSRDIRQSISHRLDFSVFSRK